MNYSKGGECPFSECLIDDKEAQIAALQSALRKAVDQLKEYNFFMPTEEATALLPILEKLVRKGGDHE